MIVEEGSLLFAFLEGCRNIFDHKKTKVEIGDSWFNISAPARRRLISMASLAGAPPMAAGRLPRLMHSLGYRMSDEQGNVFAEYSGDVFDIFFDTPAAHADSFSFRLEGISISIDQLTQSKLSGKTLMIKSVKDGRPAPNSRKARLMVAE